MHNEGSVLMLWCRGVLSHSVTCFQAQAHLTGRICATANWRCGMQCGFTVNIEDLSFEASLKLNSLSMQETYLPF